MNQAAERVAPEKRALRAAQNFNTVHVHEARQGLAVARPVQAIGVERNRDIVGFDLLGPRAAQRGPRIGAGHSELEAGRQDFETEGIGNPQRLQLVAGHGGNGHRNVLQTLVALLRGNHDFFERALRLCAACRSQNGEHSKRNGGAGKRAVEIHKLSPRIPKNMKARTIPSRLHKAK